MKSGFFATFFYQPIYNGLVFLISVVPGHNVGVSIITLTILVRSALLPLAHKSVVSQAKMRAITPHIEKLKEKHKDNKHFLGKFNDTAYYFNYEQDEVTTLDHAFLATMKTKAEQYVIYADNCLLTKDFMTKHHIIFKKIPRDITRF